MTDLEKLLLKYPYAVATNWTIIPLDFVNWAKNNDIKFIRKVVNLPGANSGYYFEIRFHTEQDSLLFIMRWL